MSNSKLRKVFLVDDDDMHTQMLKDHMQDRLNVDITTFSTGEDCIKNLDKEPDVIVLDYHLSSVDKSAKNGVEILKEIKKQSPTAEVIMLSGQDKIEIAIETMQNGAYDYVIKNESAFVRAENIAINIFKGIKLQENLVGYRKATLFLGIAIVAIIIIAIVLMATGIGKEPGTIL